MDVICCVTFKQLERARVSFSSVGSIHVHAAIRGAHGVEVRLTVEIVGVVPMCGDPLEDGESTIPLNEITSQIPPSIAITPILPTLEPENSLIMGDEDLSTIPEKESNEVIKSSVEDFVPIPSESEDTSGSDIDDYYDSEGDIIYLESLLIKDTIPNLPPEVFLDRDPRSLKDEPDNDELKSMVKVFDPEIHEKIISLTYVRLPFEDRHYFPLTFAIRIFLPYLTYSKDSSLLLSSRSEDTIFDLDISIFSCYSLEPVFKSLRRDSFSSSLGGGAVWVKVSYALAHRLESCVSTLDVPSSKQAENGGLFKTSDFLIPLDEHLATFRGHDNSLVWGILVTDIAQKDKNKAKTDKTEHGNGMSSRKQSRRRIHP
ncbi:hypothetical protein Tco_0647067 [Tanacetum coccineum]